jgi:hypothetical protein
MTGAPPIRCREISAADEDAVISLLVRIFRGHDREFWIRALRRITVYGVVQGYPECGYLLERNGSVVGVLLLIFRSMIVDDEIRVSCNVSSWCVDPDARSYASMLVSRALKLKYLTFLNVSASPHTFPILAAQGYRRYASGLFVSFPALLKPFAGGRIVGIGAEAPSNPDITAEEAKILQSHQTMGCVVVLCHIDGRRIPFVFLKRHYRRVIPYAHLVYCRSVEDFVRAAGLIGRFLLLHHGLSCTVICSNGPISGLPGKYFETRPKYFKGPHKPRLGDLAYTELVLLGL